MSIPLYANSGGDAHDRTWEQRFWVDSPKGGIADYTVGIDYWGENLDTFAHDHYYDNSDVTTWYGSTSNTGKYVQRFGKLNDNVVSLYANSTWHLNDQLDLITGLRGSYEKKPVPSSESIRTILIPAFCLRLSSCLRLPPA